MDISQDSVSSTISLLFDSSAELELLAEELEFFALELLAVELELFTLELELLADELEFFALELELFALEQELFALELELLADELEFFALESEFFTLELLSSSPQSMKSRGSESSFGVGLSEQLELKKSTTEYFPYVLFFYGGTDSAFVKNIEKFRKNFTSGLWQDSVARVKSADYLLKNYYMLYELLDDWALKEKLVRQEYDYCYVLNYMSNVLSKSYDSMLCAYSGQTFQISAPASDFYKDSVVCVDLESVNVNSCTLFRPFTDLEKKLGSCVYEKNAKDVTKEYDGNTYICRHSYRYLIPDSTNVENWKLKRDD